MSDSESSSEDVSFGITAVVEEPKPPSPPAAQRNNGDGDQNEEFQKLLRSMMDSPAGSGDEDGGQDEANDMSKISAGKESLSIGGELEQDLN